MSSSLESSIVRICRADGAVVGAGFLVGERRVLTCAHVVAEALGLPDDTPEKPQAPVHLDIPLVAPKQLLTARVVLWRPPRADEGGGNDIAGLELEGDPPQGAQAASLAQVGDLWEHSFRAFGFPRGQDTGVWATGRLLGRQVTNRVQIEDVKETGFAVEPGFSGTPVWDSQVQAVLGMVVAAERRTNLKTAFAIPVDVLAGSWPLLESLIHPFVFLCYARADSELVAHLKTDMLKQGIHVWIDREGFQPGTLDWEEALRTAIRAAQAVLLIASPNAHSSRYVRDELRIAELYQRPVYSLWIAGTQWMEAVPLGWGGAQYIDAREGCYETAVPELVEALNKTSSIPPKAPELDFEPRNPYKGLRAFSGEDAHDFFGRDSLINELAATLEGALVSEEKSQQCTRLLAVVGPSGSGKSSVVMAGLLPRLREGRLPGSEQWVYLDPIVPGTRPIESLTLALSEHLPDKSLKAIREDLEDDSARGLHLLATKLVKSKGTKVVLLVDQFEELFTQTSSEEERRHFLDLLVTATTEPRGPVIVLLTLRADFYDCLMRYPLLHQLMQAHQISVLPMAIPDLREAIEKPAALPDVRLTFEGDLVGDLLFEVQGQVGALPLLQFTLEQLFQRRSGRQLTLSAYRELGGVKGALTRQAEQTYTALPSEEHRKLARALFVRLIDSGVTEQDTTRRRAALSEFSLAEASQTRLLQEVADAFIAARLLTTNEIAGTTTIEVSHEALIREWPRLAGWLRVARDDIRLQHTISEDAANWEQRKKPGGRLYRGSQLKEARAWARRNTPSGNEVAFLRASVARRRFSIASVMVAVLLLLSTIGLADWFHSLIPPDPTRVTTLNDVGPGSLRWDSANAPSGSTITFDPSLWGHTIVLTSDLPITQKHLSIQGPGVRLLTISSSTHQIDVRRGASISISGLSFKGSTFNTTSLLSNEGTLTLSNSTISGNTATSGDGGGILNDSRYRSTTLTLSNSTVSHNTASSGGGILSYDSVLTLTNSTVSGNTANKDGGGIAVSEDTSYNQPPPSLMLLYCTVYGNSADVGGGIWVGNLTKGHVIMGASIVDGNKAHTDPDIVGPLTTLGYNLVGDRSGTTFLGSPKVQSTNVLGVSSTDLGIDPMLRDNGGSAKPHTRTHALLPGSPAIDLIPPDVCMMFKVFNDQRGVKRPQGKGCDSGAYEYSP